VDIALLYRTLVSNICIILLQLKALSASFTRTRDAYNACQAEIVLKAVDVAATYAGVFRDIADKIGTYTSHLAPCMPCARSECVTLCGTLVGPRAAVRCFLLKVEFRNFMTAQADLLWFGAGCVLRDPHGACVIIVILTLFPPCMLPGR
jgi:hypothetical protein